MPDLICNGVIWQKFNSIHSYTGDKSVAISFLCHPLQMKKLLMQQLSVEVRFVHSSAQN